MELSEVAPFLRTRRCGPCSRSGNFRHQGCLASEQAAQAVEAAIEELSALRYAQPRLVRFQAEEMEVENPQVA